LVTDEGSVDWGRLVRAEFGRLLRRSHRRHEMPAQVTAARVRRPRLIALALVLVLVGGGGHAAAGLAAPAATPDPDPAAKGATGTPAPDPYPDSSQSTTAPPAREPATTPSQVTQLSGVSATTTTTTPSTPEPARTEPATPARKVSPQQRPQSNAKSKPSTRAAAPPKRHRSPAVPVAAAAGGGRLFLGGLALGALALVSGSLLVLTTRAGGLEPRA
jgi:hypothetical protein